MTEAEGTVETARTRLVLMSSQFMDLILAGEHDAAERTLGADVPVEWPNEDDRWLLRLRSEQMRDDPSHAPWLARAIVERVARHMIGHIGFHGPPDESGVVEVGYTIFVEHRRRGYAEEAVRSLVKWAYTEHGVKRFRASVAPDNYPSLRLIEKLGFFQVGVHWDERDGRELVFEANHPLRSPSDPPPKRA